MTTDNNITDAELAEAEATLGTIGQHRRSLDAAERLVSTLRRGRQSLASLEKAIADRQSELARLNAETLAEARAAGEAEAARLVDGAKKQASKILEDARHAGRTIQALTDTLRAERDQLRDEIASLKLAAKQLAV